MKYEEHRTVYWGVRGSGVDLVLLRMAKLYGEQGGMIET